MRIFESCLQVFLSENNHLNQVESALVVVFILVDYRVFVFKENLVRQRSLDKPYQLFHVLVLDYYRFYRGLLTKSHFLFKCTHVNIIETQLHNVEA